MQTKRRCSSLRTWPKDGTPAAPPTLQEAVPNWQAGDVSALGAGRSLRVIKTRLNEDADGDSSLTASAVSAPEPSRSALN